MKIMLSLFCYNFSLMWRCFVRPLETNARIRRRCIAVFRASNIEREHVNWATKYSKDDNCNRDMSSELTHNSTRTGFSTWKYL